MSEQRGLYRKYIVTKANGEPTDPRARYFVLRLDTDPFALRAVLEYARLVEESNPKLASDIRRDIFDGADRIGGLEVEP